MNTPASQHHYKPRLQRLLTALRLDVDYERGQGASLFFADDAGRQVEVVDLVGGFGSLLLGHAHPELVAAAQRQLGSARPVFAQGSRAEYARRLAAQLSARAGGDHCCVLANSGTKAVEAALKHALRATGGRTLIAVAGGFRRPLGVLADRVIEFVGHPGLLQCGRTRRPSICRPTGDGVRLGAGAVGSAMATRTTRLALSAAFQELRSSRAPSVRDLGRQRGGHDRGKHVEQR